MGYLLEHDSKYPETETIEIRYKNMTTNTEMQVQDAM
jgi:hypothetical protein